MGDQRLDDETLESLRAGTERLAEDALTALRSSPTSGTTQVPR